MTDSPNSRRLSPALDALEADFLARLALVRRNVSERVSPIESALERYRRALEEEGARKLSLNHSLARVTDLKLPSERAAELLLAAVKEALPEVDSSLLQKVQVNTPTTDKLIPRAVEQSGSTPEHGRNLTLEELFPYLLEACNNGKIVLVGAFAGRKKALPGVLDSAAEWIDTAQDGRSAVGNLSSRIKHGRVCALVICDRVITHKVTEPLLAAARTCGVPVGFAGQGGNAKLAEALKTIEGQLAEA